MAIEHKTVFQNVDTNNTYLLTDVFTPLLNAFEWAEGSGANGNEVKYCFDDKCYFTLKPLAKDYGLMVTIGYGSTSKSFELGQDSGKLHYTAGIGKTSKCVCVCIGYQENGDTGTTDPHSYNIYYGDITKLDGSTSKGIIYTNVNKYSDSDNSYFVATDEGISSEATFTSTIDATKKGYLIPVTDSTTGAVFKDVYMMACAPVQYNKMKIADTGNKYLCGKSICIAD